MKKEGIKKGEKKKKKGGENRRTHTQFWKRICIVV
jgi:hypothetical protein